MVLADVLNEHIVGRVRHVIPKRLHERPIRIADILVAGTKQYDRAFTVRDPPRFHREPRLADARLPGQQDEMSLPLLAGCPVSFNYCLLLRAAIKSERRDW